MAVYNFKQVLQCPLAVAQEHNIVGIREVIHVRVNLNTWVALQGLDKTVVDYVFECTSLSNTGK